MTATFTASAAHVSDEALLDAAKEAYETSYAPYSDNHVGAALLGANGKVYQGCNIEMLNFSGTICAERTALAKAVSEGVTEFKRVAVACDTMQNMYPCGVCREVMAEFGPIDVIVEADDGSPISTSLSSLIPFNQKLRDSERQPAS